MYQLPWCTWSSPPYLIKCSAQCARKQFLAIQNPVFQRQGWLNRTLLSLAHVPDRTWKHHRQLFALLCSETVCCYYQFLWDFFPSDFECISNLIGPLLKLSVVPCMNWIPYVLLVSCWCLKYSEGELLQNDTVPFLNSGLSGCYDYCCSKEMTYIILSSPSYLWFACKKKMSLTVP